MSSTSWPRWALERDVFHASINRSLAPLWETISLEAMSLRYTPGYVKGPKWLEMGE
jgi:hypothetical protein